MTEKRFTSEDYFMSKTKWELKLCNNGLYYVWQNNELYIQKDNGEYILFDECDKEHANDLINILNEYEERIRELKWSNKILRANRKGCERGRIFERKQWEKTDKMRVKYIKFLQKRLKKNGLSFYINDGESDD